MLQNKTKGLYIFLVMMTAEVWKKLHNEELNNLYYAPNIVKSVISRTG
jgi:hypothetical protein